MQTLDSKDGVYMYWRKKIEHVSIHVDTYTGNFDILRCVGGG